MVSEKEYEAMSDRYADPDVPAPKPLGKALSGEAAAEAGRAFLIQEYGSAEAVENELRRGRPRVGEARGGSVIVRGRISTRDADAFRKLEEQTGRTQADLVREGVRLLLQEHHVA